jgi:hypothetical protein
MTRSNPRVIFDPLNILLLGSYSRTHTSRSACSSSMDTLHGWLREHLY